MKDVTKFKHAGMLRVFVVAALVLLFAAAGVGAVSALDESTVAVIDTVEYSDLKIALDAAKNGETVKLVKDVDLGEYSSTPLKVTASTADRDFTLDLHGYKITAQLLNKQAKEHIYVLQIIGSSDYHAKLTIEDSVAISPADSKSNTGAIIANPLEESDGDSRAVGALSVYRDGELVINSGKIITQGDDATLYKANAYAIDVNSNDASGDTILTINDGYISSMSQSGMAIRAFCNSGTHPAVITVNDGIIEGAGRGIWMHWPTNKDGSYSMGEFTITGGKITADRAFELGDFDRTTQRSSITDDKKGFVVTVTGGEFTSKELGGRITHPNLPILNAGSSSSVFRENTETTGAFDHVKVAVAKVGETYYYTFADAVNAASEGSTIEMLANVFDVGNQNLEKEVILNGNGHTISGNSGVYINSNGGTVKDVKFKNIHDERTRPEEAGGGKGKLSAIYANGLTGNARITGCSFDTIDWDAIQITPKESAVIDITGNEFSFTPVGDQARGYRYVHIQSDKNVDFKATVTGNTFADSNALVQTALEVYYPTDSEKVKLERNTFKDSIGCCVLMNAGENRYDLIFPLKDDSGKDCTPAVVWEKGNTYFSNDLNDIPAGADAAYLINDLKLTGDVELNHVVDVVDVVNKNGITLDLNGNTLTGRLNLKSGALDITGTGIVTRTSQPLNVYGSAEPVVSSHSVLTIGKDVTVTAEENTVCLFGPTYDAGIGYGAVINVLGKIYATKETDSTEGAIFVSGNLGKIVALNSEQQEAMISSNYVNLTSGCEVYGGEYVPAIVLNGAATVNVYDGAKISGHDGITVKSGHLMVYGGEISAVGAAPTDDIVVANGNGAEVSGSAVTVSSNYNKPTDTKTGAPITVALYDGTFTSVNNHAVYVAHSGNTVPFTYFALTINDGKFSGATGKEVVKAQKEITGDLIYRVSETITGGIFSAKPDANYIGDKWACFDNPDTKTKVAYPYAVLEKLTVTFMNGDTPHDVQTVPVDGYAVKPSAPAKEGCRALEGWFTAATGGEKYDFSEPVTESITLYAHWVESHTAEKVAGYAATCTKDGLTDGAKCKDCGKSIEPLPSSIPATGHKYSGENVKIITKEPTYSEEGSYELVQYCIVCNEKDVIETGSIPKLQPETKFTVTYNGNGAEVGSVPVDLTKYAQNAAVTALSPENLEKTGYTFAGWSEDPKAETGDVAVGSSFTIKHDTTLNAVWTPITYTVAFTAKDCTGTMVSQTFKYNEEKQLSANAFTHNTDAKKEYTFAGWALSETGAVKYVNTASVKNLAKEQGATVNLYAQWTAVTNYNVVETVSDPTGGQITITAKAESSIDDQSGENVVVISSVSETSEVTVTVKSEVPPTVTGKEVKISDTNSFFDVKFKQTVTVAPKADEITEKPVSVDIAFDIQNLDASDGKDRKILNDLPKLGEGAKKAVESLVASDMKVAAVSTGKVTNDETNAILIEKGITVTFTLDKEWVEKRCGSTNINTIKEKLSCCHSTGDAYSVLPDYDVIYDANKKKYVITATSYLGFSDYFVLAPKAPITIKYISESSEVLAMTTKTLEGAVVDASVLTAIQAVKPADKHLVGLYTDPEFSTKATFPYETGDDSVTFYANWESNPTPGPEPEPEKPSHSSRGYGASIWLPATTEPTPTPTPTADEPGQTIPTASPVKTPTQTPASPAPFVGLLAGLGAAAVFFGLRRK